MNIPKLPEGAELLLALSGGADSMVMLDLLAKENRYRIEAVTVNHNIRKEGADDAEFTRRICRKYGISCVIESVDVPFFAAVKGLSVETAARILRREAIRKHANGRIICLAHHADDQAETVLMHLLRGCGTDGLNGMKVFSEGVFRPLLGLTKTEILSYAERNGIEFVLDATNFDASYKRNFVRLNVMPILNECYGGASRAICALAQRTSADSDYLEREASRFPLFADYGEGFVPLGSSSGEKPTVPHETSYSGERIYSDDSLGERIDSGDFTDEYYSDEKPALAVKAETEALNALHPAIKVRVIRRMLALVGSIVDAGERHVEAICSLAENTSGKRLFLHNEAYASVSFGFLFVRPSVPEDKSDLSELPISLLIENGSADFGDYVLTLGESFVGSEGGFRTLRVSAEKLPPDCVIRTRKEGDSFRKFGGRTKKLKDFLIERKIPAEKRNGLPLICSEKAVLVVCGTEISEDLRITRKDEKTYYISTKPRRADK